MGTERWYIALPGDCDLLKRAQIDPAFGEYLGCPSIFETGGHDNWPRSKVFREFCEAVKHLNVEHPGIAARVFTLDRSYDKVHYLISEARRTGEDEDDLGSKAIRGATSLPSHLKGGQGHSIRYSSPEEVAAIANWLSAITFDSLRRFYFPEDMDLTVYKFVFYPGDPDLAFEEIRERFNGLKAFYSEVALHGEAIVTVVT